MIFKKRKQNEKNDTTKKKTSKPRSESNRPR